METYFSTKRIFLSLCVLAFLLQSCNTAIKTNADELELVSLPDGSIALLNSDSSISYDEGFEERAITQTGEVFYIVEKGAVPFRVTTEYGMVEVLGTEFNVKATVEALEVEVEKGVVQLKTSQVVKDVKRGQKAFVKDVKKGVEMGKAEFKHQHWTKQLSKDLRVLKKELKKGGKQLQKESRKFGKQLKKELKKIG